MKQSKQTFGLVEMLIHTLKNGSIHNQGKIIGTDSDVCIVQRYSWLTGCPTDVIAISKADIFNQEKCRMYSTEDDMNYAYEREMKNYDAKAKP